MLPCYSQESAFNWVYLSLSPLPFTSLLFSAICKAYSDNHFAFLYFFFWGMVLVTISCTMLQTSVHSSSWTLPTRLCLSNPLSLFVTSTVNTLATVMSCYNFQIVIALSWSFFMSLRHATRAFIVVI